jgi:hypothetical protein
VAGSPAKLMESSQIFTEKSFSFSFQASVSLHFDAYCVVVFAFHKPVAVEAPTDEEQAMNRLCLSVKALFLPIGFAMIPWATERMSWY